MIALPRIAIQSKIYESANSLVYRGIRDDGMAIVVKLLKQDYPSPQELIRYRQEYAITSALDLEGVVKAYSLQDYQRTLVILLEDFGGESIEQWMQQSPESYPMPLDRFLPLAIALTDILGKIHAANIIHKDINPGNIVLNPDTGVVKIIDFGIATQFNRTNPTFKSPHVLEGTPAYLSPEQTGRMNRLLDYRTDFYSLGVTFYQLLTGQLPFVTADILELVHCHIAKQPIPPHKVRVVGRGVLGVETGSLSSTPDIVFKAVSDIVMKLMAKNAEDRYQSAWGIKADLEQCLYQLTTPGQIDAIQLGLQDVSDHFQIPQKLYGREAEIETLLTAFEQVAGNQEQGIGSGETFSIRRATAFCPPEPAAHSSKMMLVSGYAGVGKSALVQELYKPITARRGYFIAGKFDQFQRNIPYSAIAHAFQKLVRQLLSEPEEQVQQWRSRLLAALGNNGQLIVDVIPELALIVGPQTPIPEVGATETQNRFHRVFQQFVRVFCAEKNPLVIFLDDLQWIDSATLKLIELMLLDDQIQSLFLIGAYRDNEVSPSHPLMLALEMLRKQGAQLQHISLAPLTLQPVNQLIAETLHQDAANVCFLSELVLRKTGGNPFFVGEFLRSLYSENLLRFRPPQSLLGQVISKGGWYWDIDQIQAQNITDNVVELLLGQLKKLPAATQQLLQVAACIGTEFDLDTLAIVCERSPTSVFQSLLAVAQAGFIQSLSELDQNLCVREFKFLHDRVQQAAYALIDESQKQVVHLQIGRNLLEKTAPEQLFERLFEIVDHLNNGAEQITDQLERDNIAKLNLMAAQKAKGAIAYDMAQTYLAMGRSWLAASSWQTNYELTLELYTASIEVAYLRGEFGQIGDWAAIVLQEAKTILDTMKVYEINIQTEIARGQPLEAINIGLQVLRYFGITFPEQPTSSDIQVELNAIASLLNNRSIKDLVQLPQMTDPQKLAAIQIMSKITIAAQIAAPNLMPILVSKQVNFSIQFGNAFVSSYAYATFGLILCGIVKDIELGYQFGQLALNLLSQFYAHPLKAKTLLVVNYFIIPWKEHLRETVQPLLEGYQSGLETGDLEAAAHGASVYCFQSLRIGEELAQVEQEMRTYSTVIRQLKQETTLNWLHVSWQMVLNLMGRSADPMRLVGDAYDEIESLPQHEAAKDGFSIFSIHFNKLVLCYLFSHYAQAVENSIIAERYLLRAVAAPSEPVYYFYNSLARLAIYLGSSAQVQAELLDRVAVSQEKMARWADYAPTNCLHKYHLVEAEKARVLGQLLEAEDFYEQAIQGARENEYIQEEALAYELAAKFYLGRGREKFAQTYMKEAHYCYARWGATAKVNDLQTRYPQFFASSSGKEASGKEAIPLCTTTGNVDSTSFDLVAVLKASQSISREIELEQLLNSLMQILIENAGAQTGYLILEHSGEWVIEAACEFSDVGQSYATRVLQSIPIANRLPESVIQYVIRTHESVILNDISNDTSYDATRDLTHEDYFANDPYIQQHPAQSIFCLPLLNQSQLVGVLYLENRLTTGAFTSERFSEGDATRSQVLQLLSTQAAIAIENARIYAKLQKSKSQLTQFLEAIPVGVAVVDKLGHPYYFNQRATELLAKDIDPSLTRDDLTEVYQAYLAGSNQKYPTERMPIIRALEGEYTAVDDIEIHHNNAIIPIEAWGTPVFDEQGTVIYAIAAFQDITERKQAEQLLANYNRILEQQVTEQTAALQKSEAELREREQELRLLTDALPVCIIYVDADQRYRFTNRTYEEWFHCKRGEVLGKHVWENLGENAYQVIEPYINQALAGQVTTYEAEIPCIFGKRYVSSSFIPAFDANAQVKGYYGLITDISDRKRAEATSILEERNRMAREIHDTLAQAFTGILVQVGGATQVLADDLEATQSHLDMIDELARMGLAEARRSVAALRPQFLVQGDLPSAFHHLVTQMRASTDTVLSYETKGTAYPLPPEIENNLLRMGQEALTNAIKYADAATIWVELAYEDTNCILRVKDDGRGFGVGSVPLVGGFGLLGMSERAEHIGAQLTIQSQPGQGTEIVVIVNRV